MSPSTGSAPDTQPASPARSAWVGGGWLLALLPAACCGLLLLLGLGGSAAVTGWVLGGFVGVALLGAASVLAVAYVRRRRAGVPCRTGHRPTGGVSTP